MHTIEKGSLSKRAERIEAPRNCLELTGLQASTSTELSEERLHGVTIDGHLQSIRATSVPRGSLSGPHPNGRKDDPARCRRAQLICSTWRIMHGIEGREMCHDLFVGVPLQEVSA